MPEQIVHAETPVRILGFDFLLGNSWFNFVKYIKENDCEHKPALHINEYIAIHNKCLLLYDARRIGNYVHFYSTEGLLAFTLKFGPI